MNDKIVKDIRGTKFKVIEDKEYNIYCKKCDANYGPGYCSLVNYNCSIGEYAKLIDENKKLKLGSVVNINDISYVATKGNCKNCEFSESKISDESPYCCKLKGYHCNGKGICLKHFKGGV